MRLIRHTGIFVNDLELMKDFYCKIFDLEVSIHDIETGEYIQNLYNLTEQKIEVELYKLSTVDGCMIELLRIKPNNNVEVHATDVFNLGCMHIAFTVKNIDMIYDSLKEEGVYFYSIPQLSRDGLHKVCICRDPEGNYLELVQEL